MITFNKNIIQFRTFSFSSILCFCEVIFEGGLNFLCVLTDKEQTDMYVADIY